MRPHPSERLAVAAMSKLEFNVVSTSGEDVDYPASELNTHSPHTKGWQSPRFCEFPQELGLELMHRSRLTQVRARARHVLLRGMP